MRASPLGAVREHAALWLVLAAAFVAAYHALLLGAMIVRFGHLPNFVRVYDALEAYRLTFTGTPSLLDAVRIAAAEPWLEVGYMSPQWRLAEWSLMILAPQLALVSLVGALVATFCLARRAACSPARRAPPLAAALGAGLAAVANATLFWVVCCASPTWIVGLAMLGVSVSVAFMLEPLGPLLNGAGLALLTWATAAQLRRRVPAVPRPSPVLLTAQRSA